ncbi:unnamed protein product [Prorocentrum cordatum]|uniref:FAD/NAD(P)-binding domain-containing protein n=1 Tax=Prorocentrum cordatum TaxID=2364126 RepID=A0ABN9SC98_9DINO|nr:unnamed protein product [Polarella glacialis]
MQVNMSLALLLQLARAGGASEPTRDALHRTGKIELVVFDKDGTLTECDPAFAGFVERFVENLRSAGFYRLAQGSSESHSTSAFDAEVLWPALGYLKGERGSMSDVYHVCADVQARWQENGGWVESDARGVGGEGVAAAWEFNGFGFCPVGLTASLFARFPFAGARDPSSTEDGGGSPAAQGGVPAQLRAHLYALAKGCIPHFDPAPEDVVGCGDIASCFAKLEAVGVKLAVCTSDDRNVTSRMLEVLGVDHFVQTMACGDDPGIRQKPAPDGILQICQDLAVPVGRSVMVGDSLTDIQAPEPPPAAAEPQAAEPDLVKRYPNVIFVQGEVHKLRPGAEMCSAAVISSLDGSEFNVRFEYCLVAAGRSFGPSATVTESLWKPTSLSAARRVSDWPALDERTVAGRRRHILEEHRRLSDMGRLQDRGRSALVVGADYQGVEWACDLRHFFPGLKVILIDEYSRCLHMLPVSAAAYAQNYMDTHGIETFYEKAYDPKRMSFWTEIGLQRRADFVYVLNGISAHNGFLPPQTTSGKGPGGGGWVVTNSQLQVCLRNARDQPVQPWASGRVFAAGDCHYGAVVASERPGQRDGGFAVPPVVKTQLAAACWASLACRTPEHRGQLERLADGVRRVAAGGGHSRRQLGPARRRGRLEGPRGPAGQRRGRALRGAGRGDEAPPHLAHGSRVAHRSDQVARDVPGRHPRRAPPLRARQGGARHAGQGVVRRGHPALVD